MLIPMQDKLLYITSKIWFIPRNYTINSENGGQAIVILPCQTNIMNNKDNKQEYKLIRLTCISLA